MPIAAEDAIGPVARINRPTPRSSAPPTIPRTMETRLRVGRDGQGGHIPIGSTSQRLPEERQAHVVRVVDVGVGVFELTVDVSDVPVEELPVQGPGTPDQVELILRPAVDVHEPQPTEPRTIPIDHVHRIPRAPTPPDLGSPLPGLEVEREVDLHLLAPLIRRVVRRRPARVDVWVPADPGEAVDERDDHRAHLPGPDEAVELRLQVLAERIDAEEHLAGPGVSDNPIRRGIPFSRIVSGRKVDSDIPLRRVPQRIAPQHLRIERLDDDLSSRHADPAEGSRAESIKSMSPAYNRIRRLKTRYGR